MKIPLVYRQGAVFGCDIGSQTVKVVELGGTYKKPKVVGYGYAPFDPKTMVKGAIANPEALAKTVKALITKPQTGQINAKRVVSSIPISQVFVRTLTLPPMDAADLAQAIQLEAEQYIPVPVRDLYIDHEILSHKVVGKESKLEIQMVAAPRAIIDSYIRLFDALGLFTEVIEIGQSAILRSLFYNAGDITLLADFGSELTDFVVSDHAIRLSSTVPVGGNKLTQALQKELKVTAQQADEIKKRYGIGESGLRKEILKALKDPLDSLTHEISKAIKYYHDRSENNQSIQKIVLSGGSAYLPGLMEYLTQTFRLPVVIDDPWQNVKFEKLPQPSPQERAMYTTAVGLGILGLKT